MIYFKAYKIIHFNDYMGKMHINLVGSKLP
jgi:hypothetical protein